MTEPRPVMTPGRAALIELLAQYARYAMGDASLIEAQKLTYFLQLAGEPLNLDFVGHHYGPYADKLRHVLKAIEDHYLSGFGDGSTPAQEAELTQHPQTAARIARVLQLVEGFETPYALELLATVHWVVERERHSDDDASVIEAVRSWSPRKGRMFAPEHISVALETLRSRGWTSALAAAR